MNFQIQLHCLPCSRVKLWTSSRRPKSQSELFEHAKGLAAGCDIEPSMSRMPPSQCHRVNVPAATPQQYWYRALYLPLIDQLIQELNDRLLTHHDLFLGQYLIAYPAGSTQWRYQEPNIQHLQHLRQQDLKVESQMEACQRRQTE